MMPRFTRSVRALGLCIALLPATHANAEGLDQRTRDALAAMPKVQIDTDLTKVAADFRDLAGKPILWRDAASIVDSSLAREPSGRAAITRLLNLALVLENNPVKPFTTTGMSIDKLEPQDIQALREGTGGFPDTSDQLLYLLARKPSLRAPPNDGEYV